MKVSVVVPVYKSAATITALVEAVSMQFSSGDFEIILVDDGSDDSSWSIIQEVCAGKETVRGVRLGRNVGQHSALLAGVRQARYPITVTLDDDLQNPPDQIPILISALSHLKVDVVYGVPREASHSAWRRFASSLIRHSLKSAMGIDEARNMSSFRAFRTDLRSGFAVDVGPGVSLDALLSWSTARFGLISVNHAARASGSSNYTLPRLIKFSIDTLSGYTTVPLRLASAAGVATALFGLVLMLAFVLWPFVQGISIQGFPFLASTIILFSGIQLITLGIFGEYLARMHFRIMRKPTYVIAEVTDAAKGEPNAA